MAKINKKSAKTIVKQQKPEAHHNYMHGLSYQIGNPIHNLRLAAASCFFGEPMYYQPDKDKKDKKVTPVQTRQSRLDQATSTYLRDTLKATDPMDWRGMSPMQLMETAIDRALDYDVEKTLQVAVDLRNEDNIRVTPQVILVKAANHPKSKGTNLIRKYGPKIMLRADEPVTCFAYQKERIKKNMPSSLKRAIADKLSTLDEYALAKYRLENKQYKLVDLVKMIDFPYTPGISKLLNNELKLDENTWESYISKNGSNKKTWTEAIDLMGHMALLRNLRNLVENKVDANLFVQKLIDGAKTGRQLPFRYYSAYTNLKAIASPKILDAVEESLIVSLDNLPKFSGRVMSLCDNSGSAQGATTSSLGTVQVNTIANLMGVLTGQVADEGYVGVFGDKLESFAVRKRSSIFEQLEKADKIGKGIGQSTENGIWLFWDKAIKAKEHWDHVFVYSDMQAGHGGLYGTNPNDYREYMWRGSRHIDVPKLINEYRKRVNPDIQVYLVQVAGYQDTIVPEYYDKTYILGGWSDNVLKFANKMMNFNQLSKQ